MATITTKKQQEISHILQERRETFFNQANFLAIPEEQRNAVVREEAVKFPEWMVECLPYWNGSEQETTEMLREAFEAMKALDAKYPGQKCFDTGRDTLHAWIPEAWREEHSFAAKKNILDVLAAIDTIRELSDGIVERLKDEKEHNIPELAGLVKHFPSYKSLSEPFDSGDKLLILRVVTELSKKHIVLFNRAVERYILSQPPELEENYREAFKSLL